MSLFQPSAITLWNVLALISVMHATSYRYSPAPIHCDDPNPVTDLEVTMTNYKQFGLTWTEPTNEVESCIHACNLTVTSGNGDLVCTHSLWREYYVNDNIYPCATTVCTNYTASIYVVSYPGISASTSVTFYTGPAKVSRLQASNTTRTETYLTWVSPDTLTCAKHYKLYHCAYDGGAKQDCVYQTRTFSLDTTSVKLGGLQPCKDNHIWLATVDKYGGENNVSIVVHTGDGHPPIIRDLKSTVNQGISATVTWLAAESFNTQCHAGYRVCSTSDRDDSENCYFTSKTTFVVKQLKPCSNYTIYVQTVDGELKQYSRFSDASSLHVFTNPAIPATTMLAGTAARWAEMELGRPDNFSASCLRHYEMVECVERPLTGVCQELRRDVLPANTTSYNSSQFTGCASSHLIFHAVGENSASSYLDLKFINGEGDLQPLTNLSVVSATTKHLDLAWTPPEFNECPHTYRVCWSLNNQRTCESSSRESGDIFTNLSLVACHEYNVRAWLMYKKLASGSINVTFHVGPANVGHQSVELTSTSALVTWWRDTTSHRCSAGYRLTWCPPSIFSNTCGPSPTGSVTVDTRTTSHMITGLETCVQYLLVFETVGEEGFPHSESNATVIRPPIEKFGFITDLTIHQWNNSTVTLDIVFPNNTTKCITKFTTCLYETGNEDTEKYCRLLRTEWVNKTQSCTNYTVDITAIAYDKQTTNGSITFVTGPGEVNKVEVMVDVDSESANVTWVNSGPRASDCMKYLMVSCTPAGASQPIVEERIPGNSTMFPLQRLTKCTSYTLQIQAFGVGGLHSSLVLHQFNTTENGLDKVRELNLTYTSEGEFSVWWQPPEHSDCVMSYRICWGTEGSDDNCETTFTNHWTSSRLDNLQSCSKYNVSVAALDRYATSSEIVSATLHTGAAQVSNVVPNISPSGKAVTVTWTFPESNVRCVSYQVVSIIRAEDNLVLNRKNVSKEGTSSGYGGLYFCHSYKVEVQPITLDAASPPVVTALFHSPSNVRSLSGLNVTGIKSDALHVSYTIAETTSNCVQYFQICWEARGGNQSCTNEQGHSSSSVNITGLKPATNYTVEVTPVNPEGHRYLTSTATGSTSQTGASSNGGIAGTKKNCLSIVTLLPVLLLTAVSAIAHR